MLTADPKAAGDRKFILPEEKYNATNFITLWDFEGVFKYSPLFYGWYTNSDSTVRGYRLPFAYFVTGLVVYAYSFFATLRKMAENSRMSKLSEKDDECIFSWKLFTAWDYMIGNAETAHNRIASIVLGFKEALLEEAEKKRQSRKFVVVLVLMILIFGFSWRVIAFRVLVNAIVMGLLGFSVYAVIMVVKRSTEPEANSNIWRKNEITIVMSLITLIFPMIFEALGFLEQFHPRKQLRLQLARIMVLNLLNLYSLIFALFDKISDMTQELQEYKNRTDSLLALTSGITTEMVPYSLLTEPTECFLVCEDEYYNTASRIDALAQNLTMSTVSKISDLFSNPTEPTFDLTTIQEKTAFENFTEYLNSTINQTDIIDLDSLKDKFVDYLTFVLNSFTNDDETNQTSFNETVFTTATTNQNFDFFKSTITTLFEDVDPRFETELTTIFQDITSTLSDYQDNSTYFKNCSTICNSTIVYNNTSLSVEADSSLNYSAKARLRSLCWETMFGQELIKLTVMDLILTVLSTLAMDFFRGLFVRFMNRCWCWDLEKKYPQYGDFKVAENILHLVNNQGMVWMGMFFSPGLVVLNVVKLYLLMYFRAWAVLTCNVPHEIIFRASRSNNFYYGLLLMMLFLCVLPVGYAIVRIQPSWHCGPFSKHKKIFHIFTKTIRKSVPEPLQPALDYIASPGIIIPLLVLLILIIYYLVSLTGALREANNDLKAQLRRERTEERRKMFQMADRRRRGGSGGSNDLGNSPFVKWKKLLGNLPSGKSLDDTPRQESEEIKEEKPENKNKDFFAKLIKRALGKSSTSDEEQQNENAEDGTDTEQQDSLPDDTKPQIHRAAKSSSSSSFDFHSTVKKAISMKSSDSSETKRVQIHPTKTVLSRRDLDMKKPVYKTYSKTLSKQDSSSSTWSDNIPVIMISKTESSENILKSSERKVEMKSEKQEFKPKIKCMLKKQTSEIDEDTIFHFGSELEKMNVVKIEEEAAISALEESVDKSSSEDTEMRESSQDTILSAPYIVEMDKFEDLDEDSVHIKSTVDNDDPREGSDKAIQKEDTLQSSTNGSTHTESSSGYKDTTLS